MSRCGSNFGKFVGDMEPKWCCGVMLRWECQTLECLEMGQNGHASVGLICWGHLLIHEKLQWRLL